MDRAYSQFEIKSVDEERRIIEGIASSPSTDRMGDVVEPLGAVIRRFPDGTPDVPIKWQHGKDPRVGEVGVGHLLTATPTAKGIPVRLQIEKETEPGLLKDTLDFVWGAIKKRLVRGLSIGFRAIDDPEPIKGTHGLRFPKWELLELSAVTIPANQDATITAIKSIDTALRAASGTPAGPHSQSRSTASPGVSGTNGARSLNTSPGRGSKAMLTIEQNIQNLEATRANKEERMEEIVQKATDENRTKDDAERQEFAELKDDIAGIDAELQDLKDLQSIQTRARPVNGKNSEEANGSRDTRVVVRHPAKLEPGIEFARFAMCVAAAKGDVSKARRLAERHYPQQKRAINVLRAVDDAGGSVGKTLAQMAELRTKADVAAGTTSDETWAGPLVEFQAFSGDFVEFLRPRTIVGQFGSDGVPDFRRIPFNVHIRGQTSGGTGYWVGEGKPKPVTKFDFNDTEHPWHKVAAISVVTEELIRFSDPAAERLVRDGLADALIEVVDETFIDPDTGEVSGVSPASITNGLTAITSSGDDADDVRADINSLWATAISANLPLGSAVYITTPSIALALSLMRNLDGDREFGGISVSGGTIDGIPTIVSNHVPAGVFVLAFASELWYSDDGMVTVDASREASLQMMDNPTNDSDTPTATAMVSMFQTDSVALRAHRFVTWSKRRDSAVAYLESVGWGGAVSS